MMDFIMLVCAIVIALLLVSFVSFVLVLNKPVMKWFTKKYMKLVQDIAEEMEENWE